MLRALLIQASLVLLCLHTSPGFAKTVTGADHDLSDLMKELDDLSKVEAGEQTSLETTEDDNWHAPREDETILDKLVDNVDHLKEQRRLSESGEHVGEDENVISPPLPVIDETYEPVGCYRDNHIKGHQPLPVLLKNLREHIDWFDLNRTIRACADLAHKKGYRYFGIQYWGECWSGPTAGQTYSSDGTSKNCLRGVGKDWANFVYRFKLDECSAYKELDEGYRAETFQSNDGEYSCDDNLTPGWYRFTGRAGTHMALQCVPKLRCGAHSPGWMNGTLPSVVKGAVSRTVCFNWRDDCCFWKASALVKNCGGYFVYRLEKPPFCRLRYCGSRVVELKRTTTDYGMDSTDLMLENDEQKTDAGDSSETGSLMNIERIFEEGNDDYGVGHYEQVGCYHDKGGKNRPLPLLLKNLRSSIDWNNLNKTIHACAVLAQAKSFRYFGIQFWGECWSGPNAGQTYSKDGASSSCIRGAGKAGSNFVYRFTEEKTTVAPTTTPEKTTVSRVTTVAPTTKPEKTTVSIVTTVAPTTTPDECSAYTELNSADRAANHGPNGVFLCDKELTKGWYRFTGKAGTRMATHCVKPLHCGTHSPGWMKGALPSVAEGAVNRTVCFNWRTDCCSWDTGILVKNCGGYYVYRLQKPPKCRLRYCGNGQEKPTVAPVTKVTTVAPTTRPDECSVYTELNSADRAANYGPNGVFLCDKELTKGWYRFTGKAGTRMVTHCVQPLHCGTHSPGWMKGSLPSVAAGAVARTVCFNWRDDCCHRKSSVLVKNCGGYYVYRLQKPPMCRLRYCGNGQAVLPTSRPTTVKPTTGRPTDTFVLCEHTSGVLRCPPTKRIKVLYANYGRTIGRMVCPHPAIRSTTCYSPVAANLVRCACNGHNSCPLYAKNQVYGDPCVGTFKYIEVKFKCV